MIIKIFQEDQEKGTIPYTSLPAFRLLCEQNGLKSLWDSKNKTLYLKEANLKGKKIFLYSVNSFPTEAEYECKILTIVKDFLLPTGAEVFILYDPPNTSQQGDVCIQFAIDWNRTHTHPKGTLYFQVGQYNRLLLQSLHKELRKIKIDTKVKKYHPDPHSPDSYIQFQVDYPGPEEVVSEEDIERIAIGLSSGIVQYFQTKHPMTAINTLPHHIRSIFTSSSPNSEPSIDKAIAPQTPPVAVEEPVMIQSYNPKPVVTPRSVAEVFFDYTLLFSDTEDHRCLVWGNLIMKNTGTEMLRNPIICLKADPIEAVRLGGQILPPNLVDTMSLQDSEGGSRGWQYVEDDWLKTAKERGEYWICPIGQLIIPAGQAESHQFQITISAPKSKGSVTIDGFVSFQEQNLEYVSNNRIALSF